MKQRKSQMRIITKPETTHRLQLARLLSGMLSFAIGSVRDHE
jgi:hypothetical protein